MKLSEKIMISWFAPRGIVAASVAGVLGHKLIMLGHTEGEKLVPVVFAVVFLTVFIFGLTIKPLAQKLELSGDTKNGIILVIDSFWALNFAEGLIRMGFHPLILSTSKSIIKKAKRLKIECRLGEVMQLMNDHTIDYSNFSALMALTENSSYNAIICQQFSEIFGWDQVFQLPLSEEEKNNPHYLPQSLRGRFFIDELSYDNILHSYDCGHRFEVVTPEEFRHKNQNGNQDFLAAVVKNRDGTMSIRHKREDSVEGATQLFGITINEQI